MSARFVNLTRCIYMCIFIGTERATTDPTNATQDWKPASDGEPTDRTRCWRRRLKSCNGGGRSKNTTKRLEDKYTTPIHQSPVLTRLWRVFYCLLRRIAGKLSVVLVPGAHQQNQRGTGQQPAEQRGTAEHHWRVAIHGVDDSGADQQCGGKDHGTRALSGTA